MNDEFKGKSGKVKVMYVRGDDESEQRSQNPRTGKGGGRPAGASRGEGGGRRQARHDDKPRGGRDRNERSDRGDRGEAASPWRTVSRAPVDTSLSASDNEGTTKHIVDPEVIRRQRADHELPRHDSAPQSFAPCGQTLDSRLHRDGFALRDRLATLDNREREIGESFARGSISVMVAESAYTVITAERTQIEATIAESEEAAERIAVIEGLPDDLTVQGGQAGQACELRDGLLKPSI